MRLRGRTKRTSGRRAFDFDRIRRLPHDYNTRYYHQMRLYETNLSVKARTTSTSSMIYVKMYVLKVRTMTLNVCVKREAAVWRMSKMTTSRKRNHAAAVVVAAVTTEKNDYRGCFLYTNNNDDDDDVNENMGLPVQLYPKSTLDNDTLNEPMPSTSYSVAAVGEEVAEKKKKKVCHRISPTAMSLSENDAGQEQNATLVDEASSAVVTSRGDGVHLISKQQQQPPKAETKYLFENFAKAALQHLFLP